MHATTVLKPNYEIAIIGSGISGSLSLLNFLEKKIDGNKTGKATRIVVIEKHKEFWKGYPYGDRSSVNSLTITTLGEFLSNGEKKAFIEWMEQNQDRWLTELQQQGGPTAAAWIDNNLPRIQRKEWDTLYVPRYLFGSYVSEKLAAAITTALQKNLATVETIEAEAIEMVQKKESYDIQLEDSNHHRFTISSHIVILAIGSPPVRSAQSAELSKLHPHTYINDAYVPSLECNLQNIQETLAAIPEKSKRNILMIGSNASSLEMIYMVSSRPELRALVNQFVVISYSGVLPHRITPDEIADYYFKRLERLKEKKQFGARTLMHAIEKDLDEAYEEGVHIGDTYYHLSDLVVELITRMELEQQKEFFNTYGMRFTKLIRRAGAEYRDAAESMIQDKTLKLLKGKFVKLEEPEHGKQGVSFSYTAEGRDPKTHYLDFPVVINCGGFEDLNHSSSRIIASLINNKLCVVNSTQRGFEVNEKFEANKNLYVMGPLLGGIFNNKVRYWHVENAKRIYALAGMLSNILIDYLNNCS